MIAHVENKGDLFCVPQNIKNLELMLKLKEEIRNNQKVFNQETSMAFHGLKLNTM